MVYLKYCCDASLKNGIYWGFCECKFYQELPLFNGIGLLKQHLQPVLDNSEKTTLVDIILCLDL